MFILRRGHSTLKRNFFRVSLSQLGERPRPLVTKDARAGTIASRVVNQRQILKRMRTTLREQYFGGVRKPHHRRRATLFVFVQLANHRIAIAPVRYAAEYPHAYETIGRYPRLADRLFRAVIQPEATIPHQLQVIQPEATIPPA